MMAITTDHTLESKKKYSEHILVSLTLIGKNTEAQSGVGLTRALEHWRRYYEENGLVSVLVINENYFVQDIQGSRFAVNNALAKIIAEYPTVTPNIVQVQGIEARRWDGFLTKHMTASIKDEAYAFKSFSAGSDYNPYLMTSAQITTFLKAIFDRKDPDTDSVKLGA